MSKQVKVGGQGSVQSAPKDLFTLAK
jgi:hypothetical protein